MSDNPSNFIIEVILGVGSYMYPMLFRPVYKEIMWGGSRIAGLGRELPSCTEPIAESWELTDRENGQSIVENGCYAGKSLRELIVNSPVAVVGPEHRTDQPFPLLIKIIDANKRLSLQVHPDEKACQKLVNAEPKTEMWYVLDCDENSRIFAGLKQNVSEGEFLGKISDPGVEGMLQTYHSQQGDAYFIPAGKIHAIGGGNLIYEVQQNSFTTYRVSDWGRVGCDGQPRELHVEEAMKSITFSDSSQSHIPGTSCPEDFNQCKKLVANCPFFSVEELCLNDNHFDNTEGRTFHTLYGIDNDFEIVYDSGSLQVPRCRTVLIPAALGAYQIRVTAPTVIIKSTR